MCGKAASLAKNGCSTKKRLQARTKLRKKSPNGGSTSLMWVSWGHVCQQFLLAPLGEVRKSTNNPQNIHVNFGKDRRVAKSQILKGSYCWRKKMFAALSGIYQTPLSIRIFFTPWPSKSYLINYNWNKPSSSYQRTCFKGTSSTRQGTVVFWLRPYQNKLRAGKGPSSPPSEYVLSGELPLSL